MTAIPSPSQEPTHPKNTQKSGSTEPRTQKLGESEADERELEEILKAYKHYPYGSDYAPHMSGEEAKAALLAWRNKTVLARLPEKRATFGPQNEAGDISIEDYEINAANRVIDTIAKAFGGTDHE